MLAVPCPKCGEPIKEVDTDAYQCAEHGIFKADYLTAVAYSSSLCAVQMSPDLITISPGQGDGEMVRVLFEEKDREYEPDRKLWLIRNLTHYEHLKCVQVAKNAFALQHSLFDWSSYVQI